MMMSGDLDIHQFQKIWFYIKRFVKYKEINTWIKHSFHKNYNKYNSTEMLIAVDKK